MYLRPLWEKESRHVYGESGLFQGEKPVRLLYKAEKILRVYNPTLKVEYKAFQHYIHTPGSDLLFPVPGSGICGIGENAIFPDPARAVLYPALDANAIKGGPEGKLLIFDNASFFARHQIMVDYCAVEGSSFIELPAVSEKSLPRFRAKLKKGVAVTVNLIGDSISEGFNATEFVKVPPFAPPYLNIFVQKLRKATGTHIAALNSAVAGTGSRNAGAVSERWLDRFSDLLIIAYGMNEFSSVPAADYIKELQSIMARKKALHPETEFILVSSMPRNPLWGGESASVSRCFAEALRELESESCAIADVHTLWAQVYEKKDFYDLTGNGVNHPNDYGHRLYAAVLTNIFKDLLNRI